MAERYQVYWEAQAEIYQACAKIQELIDNIVPKASIIMHRASILANIFIRDMFQNHETLDTAASLQMFYKSTLTTLVSYSEKIHAWKMYMQI